MAATPLPAEGGRTDAGPAKTCDASGMIAALEGR